MKRVLGAIFVVLVAACVGWTQQASSDDSAATKEDIEKLFTALHLRDLMQNVMRASMQQSKQIAHDAIKKKEPELTADQLRRMDAFMDDFAKKLDLSGMLDDMVPVYERHLTKQDVSAMLAFYESPTGQKMLREQPAMMAEAMQAMRPRMEKMMGDITDEAEKMAKEEQKATPPATSDGLTGSHYPCPSA
jgi:hypothetical protein